MTDRQFLAGMWNRVDLLADRERENKDALARSRALTRRMVLRTLLLAGGLLLLLCLLLGLLVFGGSALLLLLAVYVPFSLALLADSGLRAKRRKGDTHHE